MGPGRALAGSRRRNANPRHTARARLSLLAIAVVTLSCGSSDGTIGPTPPDGSPATLRLPVRIHLLSSRLPPLDASLTEADVTTLLARVNQVWARADVVWVVESIIIEQAEAEDEFELALLGAQPLTTQLLIAVVSGGERLTGKWDVFLAGDLTSAIGAPGIFIPSVPVILSSEVDPAGLGDPGRILAHELGHSLTLPHVTCTPEGNLMSPGCDSADRTRLTLPQIEQARAQGETGGPTRS